MTKSILFFLGVFALGLLGLLFVSGDLVRWLSPKPPEEIAAPLPPDEPAKGVDTSASTDGEANRIKVPVFDVVRGRLNYTLLGLLDDSELKNLQDIQQLKNVLLKEGRLEVPIYDDQAKKIPAGESEARPRQFVLTFAKAEYKAFMKKPLVGTEGKIEREREIVTLERGVGKTDDGSTIRFEELTFEINRKTGLENQFAIRSAKPVSIQYGYLRLESPSGLEGLVLADKGLQRLSFLPPVRTYFDTRAVKLFSMGQRGARPGDAPAADAKGTAAFASPEQSTKVAITGQGPLTFLLDSDQPTIRLEKDVCIYPIDAEPETGQPPPPPAATSFQCQLLVIEVDGKVSPPLPTRATATWEGGRIQAHHFGWLLEGDQLTWSLNPKSVEEAKADPDGKTPRGEALLTGKPRLSGEEGWLETADALFRLDEARIDLRGGVNGAFSMGAGTELEKSGRPRPARKAEGPGRAADRATSRSGDAASGFQLPREWEFKADEGEVQFSENAARGAPGRAGQPSIGSLSRLVARSSRDDGVEIRSKDDGRYRLTGRTLDYDARRHTVSVEGGTTGGPRFQNDLNSGTARSILLRRDEGIVSLRGEVAVRIEDLESFAPADAKARSGQPDGGADAKEANAGSVLPEGAGSAVELLAEEVDMRFDSNQLLGMEAKCVADGDSAAPATPVILRSVAASPSYQLSGWRMSWSHADQVAAVQGKGDGPEGFEPQLEFEKGKLSAGSIRFDRKAWHVDLLDRVHVESGFELTAGRAEVDLTEDLRPGAKVACMSSKDLDKVRKMHAWAAAGGRIELKSRGYRGTAGEATWDADSQEVHIFGEGRQEIVLMDAGKESVLSARDIVYRCPAKMVVLSGDVTGDVRVKADGVLGAEPAGKPAPGTSASGEENITGEGPSGGNGKESPAVAGDDGDFITFRIETSRVEAIVRETPGGLEPVTVRTLEKFLLVNDKYGIQLRGDEMLYDHDRRELRVFSREGRYQTLTRTHPSAQGTGVQTDQIDAREIRLAYRLAPSGGSASPQIERVVVKFRDDVTATFFAPVKSDIPAIEGGGPREEWKLRTDHLGISLIPNRDRSRIVQLALAEGNVIFSSGDSMATAGRAYFEESLRRLILRGDPQKPARVLVNSKLPPLSETQFGISNLGEKNLFFERLTRPPAEPAGLEELGRGPAAPSSSR